MELLIYLIENTFESPFGFIAVVISIIALYRTIKIKNQVTYLNNQLNNKTENNIITENRMNENNNMSENNLQANIQNNIIDKKEYNKPKKENALIAWLKEDWLMKLGGVLVFLGVLFILSMVFIAVGPVGQISIGLLIGIIFSIFGYYWAINKSLRSGMSINLLGCIIMILTIYVARTADYNIFSPNIASIMIFMISLYIAFCAFRFNIQSIAHIGLLVAGILPILVNSGSRNYLALFIYITILIVTNLWLVYFKNWRALIISSQFIAIIYSIWYLINSPWCYACQDNFNFGIFICVMIMGVLFLVNSVIGFIKSRGETNYIDVVIAFLNLIFAMMWIVLRLDDTLWGILLIIIAMLYLIAFYIVFQYTQKKEPFLIYAGSASILFMLATYYLLQEYNNTFYIMLLMESSLIVYSFYKISKSNITITAFASLGSIVPLIHSVFLLGEGFRNYYSQITDWNAIIYVLLSIIMALLLGNCIRKDLDIISNAYYISASVLLTWFVWEFNMTMLSNSLGLAVFISLFIYTIGGISVLVYGYRKRINYIVKAGRIILAIIALRILLVDAWTFDNKIIGIFICMVIGIMLILATILTKDKDNNLSTNK